jgi:DNA mismatch repair protein MutS
VKGALLSQYLRIKAEHGHAILLFRLGDFYEMFYEDAAVASRVCDLTLTARNRGEPDEVPLCGFPVHASQPYVARLLAAGHAVAICEQVEQPRGRGLMAREVVRVVTPGTILEEESLDPRAPSWLVALAEAQGRFGLAAIDFATGAFRTTEVDAAQAALEELGRLAPRELLLDASLPMPVAEACRAGRPWATGLLPEGGCEVDGLGRAAARAAGGALVYVEGVYRRRPPHLRAPEPYLISGSLGLDASTRRNLELVESRRGERRGSLLWVLDRTNTPMGARRLRDWLLAPLVDPVAIGRRLDAVERLVEAVELRQALASVLDGIGDLERLAGRIGARSASPRDLAALAGALGRVGETARALAAETGPALRELAAALDPLPAVVQAIRQTLVDAPPPHTRIPGYVRSGCSAEVDELRAITHDGKSWLARFEADERERTGIATLKVRYNKVFGYYIEVTKANLPLVPADYERKQTLVGAERFVTPALKAYEAKVLGAEERLRTLEQHLFAGLLEVVAAHHPTLARVADAIARLDALYALAEMAHHGGWVRPRIVPEPVVRMRASRHPVVEAVSSTPFVPNDVTLDASAEQILVVTGPNMGGKSTYLRQVALAVVLAHLGSFVPAVEAEIGLTDRVFTRVGASDDLAAGESTFMVEMRETAHILAQATERSLVVLDEIGRGTSTFDGISIAWAVAEHLHETAARPRTLFATHYHELTGLAAALPRVRNLSVAVAEWKGDVVFLRRIVPGPASRSYGVEVARLAGVPAPVVARARALLADLERGDGIGGPRAPAPGDGQLPLFPSADEQLRRELAALEPERMTPVEAIAVLAGLVERARSPRTGAP